MRCASIPCARRPWMRCRRPILVILAHLWPWHDPEFMFERDVDNVRRAARATRIACPIAIDNRYAIWPGLNNHYWPALYFVDARGSIRQHHFGEGAGRRAR